MLLALFLLLLLLLSLRRMHTWANDRKACSWRAPSPAAALKCSAKNLLHPGDTSLHDTFQSTGDRTAPPAPALETDIPRRCWRLEGLAEHGIVHLTHESPIDQALTQRTEVAQPLQHRLLLPRHLDKPELPPCAHKTLDAGVVRA